MNYVGNHSLTFSEHIFFIKNVKYYKVKDNL